VRDSFTRNTNSSKIQRCKAPFYVQFEVTNKCNNKCFFCYTETDQKTVKDEELSTTEVVNILDQLSYAGVFLINFNGGEPLIREDFFYIAEHAFNNGLMLHMNTNGTLINKKIAKNIKKYFRSICTSVLAASRQLHDYMSGRIGAWDDVVSGIKILCKTGVDVEVNVCVTKLNLKEVYNIAKLVDSLGVYEFCVTRYVLNDKTNIKYLLDKEDTMYLLDQMALIESRFNFKSVDLPGPIPFCELAEYRNKVKQWNVPCQIGYGLCRINPFGVVTPCPITNNHIGDLRKNTFDEIWQSQLWDKYTICEHLPITCRTCSDLPDCRGGCVAYDLQIAKSIGIPDTYKWSKL